MSSALVQASSPSLTASSPTGAFAAVEEADLADPVFRAAAFRAGGFRAGAFFAGAAVVAGALAVLATASMPFAGAIGVFTAALVTALAMVVAGIARRRSGFLTAVTIVLLVIGGSVAAASGPDRFAVGNVNLGTATYEQVLVQPFGSTAEVQFFGDGNKLAQRAQFRH